MIELVFVIVVLGILAALAMGRIERDIRQQAADNVLSAIRYTQHLALNDDKTDPFDANWQQKLWTIEFFGGKDAYYLIGSDMNKSGSIKKKESAVDPLTGKYLYNTGGAFASKSNDESGRVFLGHKYGINSINNTGGCTHKHIAFDNMGRPFSGLAVSGGTLADNDYAEIMKSDCNLTFSFGDSSIKSFSIIINKETGFAHIDKEEGS